MFDQYLRTTMVPTFEYRIAGDTLSYRWTNVVPGFDMPLRVALNGRRLHAHSARRRRGRRAKVHLANPADFKVDVNFYVESEARRRGAATGGRRRWIKLQRNVTALNHTRTAGRSSLLGSAGLRPDMSHVPS